MPRLTSIRLHLLDKIKSNPFQFINNFSVASSSHPKRKQSKCEAAHNQYGQLGPDPTQAPNQKCSCVNPKSPQENKHKSISVLFFFVCVFWILTNINMFRYCAGRKSLFVHLHCIISSPGASGNHRGTCGNIS